MKKIIIICIVIGLLGSVYLYAQKAADNYGKEANLAPIAFSPVILGRDVSIWQDDYVEKFVNVSQNEPDIEEPVAEETVVENYTLELSDEGLELMKSEADSFLHSSIVSDFLAMDSEDFENKYDSNQLYEDNILYCDMAAWRFHGYYGLMPDWEDCYDYSNIINITALRCIVDDSLYDFVEENHTDTYSLVDSSSTTDVYIQYMGDYAISIYFQRNADAQIEDSLELLEISFVQVELREEVGIAPKPLYQLLEDDYYEVREAILSEEWIISPEGNKEICVMNGWIPNNPAQIFVRYREKMPDTVFRFTWEQEIAGWIDEEHVVCNTLSWTPYLIHLETNQIEDIEGDTDEYDPVGAHYEINGNKLIARVLGEEVYRWNIVKENNEVLYIGN